MKSNENNSRKLKLKHNFVTRYQVTHADEFKNVEL